MIKIKIVRFIDRNENLTISNSKTLLINDIEKSITKRTRNSVKTDASHPSEFFDE
jgi:hypothetical protein